jgi:hypothetical protein
LSATLEMNEVTNEDEGGLRLPFARRNPERGSPDASQVLMKGP